jgi:hypothetical protein
MKHHSTREVFNYWNTRRGSRLAPERSEIDPAALRRVLADTLMLGFDPPSGHPFRIAGTRVCALFGRELKGSAFTALWTTEAGASVRDLLATVVDETVGVVAGASAMSRAGTQLELLLLPLAQKGATSTRLLGALTPTEAPDWLGAEPLGPLTLGMTRYLGPLTGPHSLRRPPLVPGYARIRHGLVVYDGGQA